MWRDGLEEYRKLHREWTIDVVNLRLQQLSKFRPSLPYVYRTGGFLIGRPWEPGCYSPALGTYDIDYTTTDIREKRHFMRNFAEELGSRDINPRFGQMFNSGLIGTLIDRMYETLGLKRKDQTYEDAQKKFALALRDAGVTKGQIIQATPPAVQKTKLAPNFREADQEAEKIGILRISCSANLDHPVEKFSSTRMLIPEILAVGAITHYDENDLVTDVTSNIGYQKFENMRRIAHFFNNNAELFLYIADTELMESESPQKVEKEYPVFFSCGLGLGIGIINPNVFDMLKQQWEQKKKTFLTEFYEMLGRTFEAGPETWVYKQIPGDIAIASAAIGDDFRLYIPPTKAYFTGRLITAFISPIEYNVRCQDFDVARQLRLELEKRDPRKFDQTRDGIVEIAVRSRTAFAPFYPEMASEIDGYLFALEREIESGNTNNQIKLIDDIIIDLEIALAEPHYRKPELQVVQYWANRFEEWRERFPNLRPGPNV